jgi:hypothetical protein
MSKSSLVKAILGLVLLIGFLASTRNSSPGRDDAETAQTGVANASGRIGPPAMKLTKFVDFGGFDDPKITAGEAFEQIEKRYDLHILFNFKVNDR